MKLKSFLIPTVIGTLPRTLFYTSLGSFFGISLKELLDSYKETGEIPANLQQLVSDFNYVLLGLIGAIAIVVLIYWFITTKYTTERETKSI